MMLGVVGHAVGWSPGGSGKDNIADRAEEWMMP